MRRTRYPAAGGRSTKKAHPAKINLTKKLASRVALTRRKPRSPVKFFALYDTNKVDAFSRQPSRSGGLCGCQPTPPTNMNATKVTVIKEDLREGRQTRLLGQTLYMWDDRPHMHYNQSKVLVSKQPDGACRFAMSPECLKPA